MHITKLNIEEVTETLINEINEGIQYLENIASNKYDRCVLDQLLPDLKDDILGSPKYYNKTNRAAGIAAVGNELVNQYYNRINSHKVAIVTMLVLAKLRVLLTLSSTIQSKHDSENTINTIGVPTYQEVNPDISVKWEATIKDGLDNQIGLIKIKEQ